jgi:hypothetical protein
VINPLSVLDLIVATCCALIAVLTLAGERVAPSSRRRVFAVGLASAVLSIVTMSLDAGLFLVPQRLFVAAIYGTIGSKGLILGWLSALIFFRQLRIVGSPPLN